jgi:hypothetical protein
LLPKVDLFLFVKRSSIDLSKKISPNENFLISLFFLQSNVSKTFSQKYTLKLSSDSDTVVEKQTATLKIIIPVTSLLGTGKSLTFFYSLITVKGVEQ